MTDLSKWIGRTQESEDVITLSGVSRFCATIGLDQDAFNAHSAAPMGYHWCLCLPDSPMSELGVDGHPKKGGFLPPVELPRRMWAASSVEFFAPLPIGATVVRHSEITSVNEKDGKSGLLVFVEVDHETHVDGQCAIRDHQTIVYREATAVPTPLPETGAARPEGWAHVREVMPTPPMLFRYSALTFNSHRIHYDVPYAKEQEMYPELVVHGPLMATLTLQLAASQGDVTKFSYRGKSPAFCNQPLYFVANREGEAGELAAIGADGRECLAAKASYRP